MTTRPARSGSEGCPGAGVGVGERGRRRGGGRSGGRGARRVALRRLDLAADGVDGGRDVLLRAARGDARVLELDQLVEAAAVLDPPERLRLQQAAVGDEVEPRLAVVVLDERAGAVALGQPLQVVVVGLVDLLQIVVLGQLRVRVAGDRGEVAGPVVPRRHLTDDRLERAGLELAGHGLLAHPVRQVARDDRHRALPVRARDRVPVDDEALEQDGVLLVPAELDRQRLVRGEEIGALPVRVLERERRLVDQPVVVLDRDRPDERVERLAVELDAEERDGRHQNDLVRSTRPGEASVGIARTVPGLRSSGKTAGFASATIHQALLEPR